MCIRDSYEPRVSLTDTEVNAFPDENSLDITIRYDIIGISAPSQSINFVLEPTRL